MKNMSICKIAIRTVRATPTIRWPLQLDGKSDDKDKQSSQGDEKGKGNRQGF